MTLNIVFEQLRIDGVAFYIFLYARGSSGFWILTSLGSLNLFSTLVLAIKDGTSLAQMYFFFYYYYIPVFKPWLTGSIS